MNDKPEEYAATHAVYDVLREGLSSSERRIAMEQGITLEHYVATKSVKDVLQQGVMSVSRSGSRDQLASLVRNEENFILLLFDISFSTTPCDLLTNLSLNLTLPIFLLNAPSQHTL